MRGAPADPPPPSRASTGLFLALANLQVQRPAIPLAVAAILTVIAVLFALRLKILTGFEYLIPESRPSVIELKRVAARTAGVSTLFVVLQGNDASRPPPTEALRKAADALVPKLETIGAPWVGTAESGVHETFRFLAPRAGLFAELPQLEKLRDDVTARYEWEVAKATGLNLDDDDPPPAIDAKKLEETFGVKQAETERYPDGYYQSKDGRTVVVAIRSKVLGSDFAQGTETIRRVREVVDQAQLASFDPSITYELSGDLATGIAEYTAINQDLTEVGYFGSALIIGVVFLYYLRIRTLITMTITIGIGVAWTFGVTQVLIGHLNMATGFLFTIVAGNGINFGIIYMARYLEMRRRGSTLIEAVRIAHRETWLPTLTAGCAAGAAYGSLVVTDFRGFRDFGLIGGVGMVLCWIATYWTLPSILAVIERVAPLESRSTGILAKLRGLTQGGVAFGTPFAVIIRRMPYTLALGGLGLALAGTVALVEYIRRDPMEYDLRNLRTDVSKRAEAIRISKMADEITGYIGADGMAILVDRPEQVPALKTVLEAKRDAAPPDKKPFKGVHALQDFVPEQQAAKIEVLLAIKDKVIRARKRGVFSAEEWKQIEPFIPPDDMKPFDIPDMPEGLARAFTETDGTRGRIVYISPVSLELVDDAHYLFRWADSYRETKLPDGSVVLGSGRAVIYADMWAAIIADVPSAVGFSLAATILVVIIAFRANRSAAAVLAALLVGVAWMAGLLVLLDVKLNFLNFIALPLTFGIGVDYAVNIVQRYIHEGAGGALTAVQETGGAVILCSLTTALGYFALVRSSNYAVRSMGIAAMIGEICCLFAAVLVLPGGLLWLDRKRAAGTASSIAPPPRKSRV